MSGSATAHNRECKTSIHAIQPSCTHSSGNGSICSRKLDRKIKAAPVTTLHLNNVEMALSLSVPPWRLHLVLPKRLAPHRLSPVSLDSSFISSPSEKTPPA